MIGSFRAPDGKAGLLERLDERRLDLEKLAADVPRAVEEAVADHGHCDPRQQD
jgi:hypothetical protein